MLLPFSTLVTLEKTIAGAPRWSEPDGIDKETQITAALDIGERTMRGLELIGRAKIDQPTRNISFSLVYHPSANRREAMPLARIDWRPPVPHTNEHPSSPPELYLLEIEGSHHHTFSLNWLSQERRLLKGLPVAEPIKPDYQSFTDLLDGAGYLFRISNIRSISEPRWAQELFNG